MNFNDPRLVLPTSSHYVSVASTGVPLSERFGKVASHNLLRPNIGVQRVVEGLDTRRIEQREERPILRNQRLADAIGPGANKLSVLRAAKDAEILRLKAELQNTQRKLRTGGGGRNVQGGLRTIQKQGGGGLIFKNRVGGGITVGRRGGKQGMVQLRSQRVLDLLEPTTSKIGVSPLKRTEKKGNGKNFFGAPRTKTALDNELDAYMNKSKSKLKTNLDKELDDYMEVARSKTLAAMNDSHCDETIETPQADPDGILLIVEPEPKGSDDAVVEEDVAGNGDMEMDE